VKEEMMNTRTIEPEAQLDPEQKRLLCDATEWSLISLLFQCPKHGWKDQISVLSTETEDGDLRAAAESAQTDSSEGLYHSIFGPGGPAPPREVSYRNWAEPGYLISELTSYYDAFSYYPEISEPVDHVAVEAGFIGYLRLKQAYALACSDTEHADIVAEACRQFVEEHLAVFAERLATRLADSGITYLARTGTALVRRTGPPADKRTPIELPILSVDDESAFDCGDA
jgi:hypothetical protein